MSDTFGGSLPAFIATFTKGKTLRDEEADEIQRLIDKSRAGRPPAHADIFPPDARVHKSEEEPQ